MSDPEVRCRACEAGLPMVWHVQSRRTMHEGPGLSVVSCDRLDAHERRQRSVANDRGNAAGKGRR